MVKVTVLYPNTPGSRFDTGYYLEKHCPMVLQRLGAACKGYGVEEGVAAVSPPGRVPYRLIAWFLFDSMDAFQEAFTPHAAAIMADIPVYTDLQPVIQASEVRA